jgi:hypothetical protein
MDVAIGILVPTFSETLQSLRSELIIFSDSASWVPVEGADRGRGPFDVTDEFG